MSRHQHQILQRQASPLIKFEKKKIPVRKVITVKLVLKQLRTLKLSFDKNLSAIEKAKTYSDKYGLTKKRLDLIKEFADNFNLQIRRKNRVLGTIELKGKINDIERAFKVKLYYALLKESRKNKNHKILHHDGPVSVPKKIHGLVDAVIGLRKIPFIHQAPDKKIAKAVKASAAVGYTSKWFGEHYSFPKSFNGSGQKIAIIACGGGYRQKELDAYYKLAGIDIASPVKPYTVDGMKNSPGTWGYDYELYTDILVTQAAAPGAQIEVYFTENSLKGFSDAVEKITKAKEVPNIITYSWSSSENSHDIKQINAIERILEYATTVHDISIVVCSGDKGSTNEEENSKTTGVMVTYPASSRWVLSCGGTMSGESNQNRIKSEKVWQSTFLYDISIANGSGGGFSNYISRPSYQTGKRSGGYPKTTSKKRGVPDVAAYADVAPGGLAYWIRFDGKDWLTGGTSSSAPLWAALIARLNQGLKRNLGFVNPVLYRMNSAGITSLNVGSNAMPSGPKKWSAQDGWDPCTGLGIPNGAKILRWLKANN